LRAIETGALKPKSFSIPGEIVLWGEPRQRLSGTIWNFGENGTLGFHDKRIVYFNKKDTIEMEYHLRISDSGKFEVAAVGVNRAKTLVLSGRIANGTFDLRIIPIDSENKSQVQVLSGALISGSIIGPTRARKPSNINSIRESVRAHAVDAPVTTPPIALPSTLSLPAPVPAPNPHFALPILPPAEAH
jgi:hypothetical protein